MRICNAAPFIRFALRFPLKPKTELFTALDCRFIYFNSGRGFMEIDGVKYRFEPHTIIMWQPGCLYKFLPENTIIDITCINFDYTYERETVRSFFDPIVINNSEKTSNYPINKIIFEDAPELSEPLVLHNAHKLEEGITEILSFQNSIQPFSDEKKTALFYNCIIDILRYTRQKTETKKIDNTLEIILQYIRQNYKNDIDNSVLAQLAGYHPYYLNRIFCKNTGKTLHQYLISYRLEISEQLLRSSETSISDIAEECGFSSIISFETNFKKKNGMSPSEFRKINV